MTAGPAVRSYQGLQGTTRLRLVLLLGSLSAFGPLSLDMYLPALPSLVRDFSTTASQIQLTLTSCLIGLAAGQLLAGPLSDRFGRRRPLLVGVTGYAIASLLCAAAPGPASLVALRLVQGAAGSAGIVISRAVVRDLHTGVAAARFFALLLLVNGLAPILAPLVGAQLLQVTDWRGIFVLLAVLGGLIDLGVLWGLPETLPPERRRPGGFSATVTTFRHLLRERTFVGYALTTGLVMGALFAYISGSSFVLQEVYGLSPSSFALIFGANAMALIAASQVSGRLVARTGPRVLLQAGVAMSAIGGCALLVAVLTGVGLAGVLPALVLVVASVGLVSPNASALALADHPLTAGSAAALIGVAQFAVGGLLAPLVGIGGSRTAVPMAAVIAASSVAAAGVMLVLLRGARSDDRPH